MMKNASELFKRWSLKTGVFGERLIYLEIGTEEFVEIQDGLCASVSQFCCTSRTSPSGITLCQCFTVLLYI